MHIINFMGIKGGVGATSIALALAKWLGGQPEISRVLYLDADFCGPNTRQRIAGELDDSEWRGIEGQEPLERMIQIYGMDLLRENLNVFLDRPAAPVLRDTLRFAFSDSCLGEALQSAHTLEVERHTGFMVHGLIHFIAAQAPGSGGYAAIIDSGPGLQSFGYHLLTDDSARKRRAYPHAVSSISGSIGSNPIHHILVTNDDASCYQRAVEICERFGAMTIIDTNFQDVVMEDLWNSMTNEDKKSDAEACAEAFDKAIQAGGSARLGGILSNGK